MSGVPIVVDAADFPTRPFGPPSPEGEGRRRRKAIVVGFAGGGLSSEAIFAALGVHPDAALNHWGLACGVHRANFPMTAIHCADIFDTDCNEVCPGEEIGLAWFSPDCRHFSKAKGGTPVSARVRGLAWVVIQWAKLRRPDVIFMENVEEWLTWGPLRPTGDGGWEPDPDRRGETAQRWFRRLRACGYSVEHRVSVAADFGDPTLRKRLMVIARRDGRPIVWPAPTHAPRMKAPALHLKPHRAAAEIIDFSRPCPSIFLSKAQARALGVKRPLEEATLRRIAKGLFRYTIAHADPFIVPVTHQGDDRTHDVREPLRTMTTSPRGEFALVSPQLVGMAHGDFPDRPGLRVRDPRDPVTTIHAGGGNLALATAHLTKFRSHAVGEDLREPLPTITANSFVKRPGGAAPLGVVAAFMEQANTDMVGHDAREAVSTIVAKGCTQRLITAQLAQMRGSNRGRGDVRDGLPTLTAGGGHQALLTAQLTHAYTSNTAGGQGDPDQPLKTLTSGNHAYLLESLLAADAPLTVPFGPHGGELRAFLVKYYGSATAEDLADPLATATSRARFGLVMVRGVAFRIVDIGMRMLDPETELAAAMGFPRGYRWEDAGGRKVTKTNITKMVGNAVCREWGAAHVRANCGDLPWWSHPGPTPARVRDRAQASVPPGDISELGEAA